MLHTLVQSNSLEELGDRRAQAEIHEEVAESYFASDDLNSSQIEFSSALALYTELNDGRQSARVAFRLESRPFAEPNLSAVPNLLRIRKLFREANDRAAETDVLRLLGDIYSKANCLSEAEASYGEALEILAKAPDNFRRAGILESLGNHHAFHNRDAEATAMYLEAEELLSALNEQDQRGRLLYTLAAARLRMGELDEASRRWGVLPTALRLPSIRKDSQRF